MLDSTLVRQVLTTVEGMQEEIVRLAADLIRIRSVNPNYPGVVRTDELGGESRVNAYLQDVLARMGLTTDLWEAQEGRANLVGVCRGAGGGHSLILNGHVDVVPAGPEEQWTIAGPWSGAVHEGRLYGRGACDMKSGDAAMIKALDAVLRLGIRLRGDVVVQTVVGEELMEGDAGTGAALARGYTAEAAIVSEPSSVTQRLALGIASPVCLLMRCSIEGKSGHACMRPLMLAGDPVEAEYGANSVEKSMIVYAALKELEETWKDTKIHPLWPHGAFTIHPGVITGGPDGPCVISPRSTLEYSIYAPPQESIEQIEAEIETCIAAAAQGDPWLRAHPPTVEWTAEVPGTDVSPDSDFCRSVQWARQQVLGTDPGDFWAFPACQDAVWLNAAGIPAVAIGPGYLPSAHGANEHVEVSELVDATKIYALAILDWCGIETDGTPAT